jgi:hypothetical protein
MRSDEVTDASDLDQVGNIWRMRGESAVFNMQRGNDRAHKKTTGIVGKRGGRGGGGGGEG